MTTDVAVRVHPKARRNHAEWGENGLKIWVTAPPDSGQANAAVIELLAKRLRCAKSNIDIVRGQTSRDKVLRIEGFSAEEIQAQLNVVD